MHGHYLDAKALPVVEIKTGNAFFDYDAKYSPGKSEEVCPAELSPELTAEIQELAVRAYKAVKAESHSRIDIILCAGSLRVLEVNTFPGLTSGSIFPKELRAGGSSLSAFLDACIAGKLGR